MTSPPETHLHLNCISLIVVVHFGNIVQHLRLRPLFLASFCMACNALQNTIGSWIRGKSVGGTSTVEEFLHGVKRRFKVQLANQ